LVKRVKIKKAMKQRILIAVILLVLITSCATTNKHRDEFYTPKKYKGQLYSPQIKMAK
jgi:hypothetical protein